MRQSVFTCVLMLSILMTCGLTGCGEETARDKSTNVDLTAGSLTFWMLPEWAGDVESQIQILHCGPNTFENHIDIFKDYRYLRLLFTPNAGVESGVGIDISDWRKGDQHMIATTWGDGVAAMYIDGVPVAAKEYEGELDVDPNRTCFLGSGNPKIKEAANNTSNLQIYTRVLSDDEVSALFAQPPG